MKRFLAMRLVALVFSFTFIVCSGFFTYASAQSNVKVTGQVTDNAGLPVIGAGVVEDGTTSGVVTDASGNYEIYVNTGAKLVFTCLGYETVRRFCWHFVFLSDRLAIVTECSVMPSSL